MPRVRIEDLTAKRQIALVTGGAGANFRLGSEAIDIAALHQLDSVAQDFLTLAAAVFYADGEVPRGGDTRPGMGKGWHRNLRLHIPVRNLGLWQRTDVTETLSETVRFLTGDTMEFRFSLATDPRAWPEVFEFDPQGATYEVEKVILFSGGLDSFAGALETLSSGPGKVLLVSHRSAQKVLHRQDALAEWLARRFPGRVRHIKVAATRIGAETHDTTQRSRSLLFAAIGHAVAANFGARQLCFFENGIVSHNLPISPQVVGTMATRTTHPQSLVLLNRLLQLISPGSTTIFNEYQWLTKTEVVQRIATYGGAEMIEAAVSCTHVRDQTTLHTHCGRCSQCLDRRFAILAARLEAHDPVERYATAMFTGPLADDRARTLVLEWTRHAIRLVDLDEGGMLRTFGSDLSRIVGAFPAEQAETTLRQVIEMHRRHGKIVRQVLTDAIAARAGEIAGRTLDRNSLLALWIGGSQDVGQAIVIPAANPALPIPIDDTLDVSPLPGPDGPWTARFFEEEGQQVVAIDHLGRVKGVLAIVPTLLKGVFLEDRASGLRPGQYRFVLVYSLPENTLSTDKVKQYVFRCRRSLAADYRLFFGKSPPSHLLIESGGKRGHRLDPRTTVIESPPLRGRD